MPKGNGKRAARKTTAPLVDRLASGEGRALAEVWATMPMGDLERYADYVRRGAGHAPSSTQERSERVQAIIPLLLHLVRSREGIDPRQLAALEGLERALDHFDAMGSRAAGERATYGQAEILVLALNEARSFLDSGEHERDVIDVFRKWYAQRTGVTEASFVIALRSWRGIKTQRRGRPSRSGAYHWHRVLHAALFDNSDATTADLWRDNFVRWRKRGATELR